MELTRVFKALADDTRLRVLALLMDRELCVCQIGEALRLSQPNASKHLNRLRDAGIIECNKVSQWCFYRFSPSFMSGFIALHAFLRDRFEHGAQYQRDLGALNRVIESNLCCREVLAKRKAEQL